MVFLAGNLILNVPGILVDLGDVFKSTGVRLVLSNPFFCFFLEENPSIFFLDDFVMNLLPNES